MILLHLKRFGWICCIWIGVVVGASDVVRLGLWGHLCSLYCVAVIMQPVNRDAVRCFSVCKVIWHRPTRIWHCKNKQSLVGRALQYVAWGCRFSWGHFVMQPNCVTFGTRCLPSTGMRHKIYSDNFSTRNTWHFVCWSKKEHGRKKEKKRARTNCVSEITVSVIDRQKVATKLWPKSRFHVNYRDSWAIISLVFIQEQIGALRNLQTEWRVMHPDPESAECLQNTRHSHSASINVSRCDRHQNLSMVQFPRQCTAALFLHFYAMFRVVCFETLILQWLVNVAPLRLPRPLVEYNRNKMRIEHGYKHNSEATDTKLFVLHAFVMHCAAWCDYITHMHQESWQISRCAWTAPTEMPESISLTDKICQKYRASPRKTWLRVSCNLQKHFSRHCRRLLWTIRHRMFWLVPAILSQGPMQLTFIFTSQIALQSNPKNISKKA